MDDRGDCSLLLLAAGCWLLVADRLAGPVCGGGEWQLDEGGMTVLFTSESVACSDWSEWR